MCYDAHMEVLIFLMGLGIGVMFADAPDAVMIPAAQMECLAIKDAAYDEREKRAQERGEVLAACEVTAGLDRKP